MPYKMPPDLGRWRSFTMVCNKGFDMKRKLREKSPTKVFDALRPSYVSNMRFLQDLYSE